MNCNKIRKTLSLYIDDMLEQDQANRVRDHLDSCSCCRQEYEQLKEIVHCLQTLPSPPLPEFYQEKIRGVVEREREEKEEFVPQRRFFASKRWKVLASAAAVFIVGIFSFAYDQEVTRTLPDTFSLENADQIADVREDTVAEAGVAEELTPDMLLDQEQDDNAVVKMKNPGPVLQASLAQPKVYLSPVEEAEQAKEVDLSAEGQPQDSPTGFAETDEAFAPADQKEDSSEQYATSEKMMGGGTYLASRHAGSLGMKGQEVQGIDHSAAARYYGQLLENELEGYAYQITSSVYDAGKDRWCFKVFIFHEKEGNTYNKEISVVGNDGKIKILWHELGME